jgi:mannose-6-phosphate isomerase-like protein (cupin superfamily)
MKRSLQRVVTGHDAEGKAIVSIQGEAPRIRTMQNVDGLYFHEIWNTGAAPALIDNGCDPTLTYEKLPPPERGSLIRVVQIPPERDTAMPTTEEERRKHFRDIGGAEAATGRASSPHPLMHRTQTIDYGIVIEGTLTLVLDDSEVELHPGDVVVQRGTNHAWSNRTDAPVLIAFVLLDARYAAETQAAIGRWDGSRDGGTA